MIQPPTPPQPLALLVPQRLDGRYSFPLAPAYLLVWPQTVSMCTMQSYDSKRIFRKRGKYSILTSWVSICKTHTYVIRTDSQIVDIAKQAYEDIQATHNTHANVYEGMGLSSATSAIIKNNTVYISSTLTGGGSYLYIPNSSEARLKYTPGVVNKAADAGILEWALKECQIESDIGAGHRTGANCGEMMAALAFIRTNPLSELNNCVVVTWGKRKELDAKGRPRGPWKTEVMNPCSPSAPQFGCGKVTGKILNLISITSYLENHDRASSDSTLLDR